MPGTSHSGPRRNENAPGELPPEVRYLPGYLSREEADIITRYLENNLDRFELGICGGVKTRKKVAHLGVADASYSYSGKRHKTHPVPPEMEALVQRLQTAFGPVNLIVANLYADGTVGLGFHADDENDIIPRSSIMSLSLRPESQRHEEGASPSHPRARLAPGDGRQDAVRLRTLPSPSSDGGST